MTIKYNPFDESLWQDPWPTYHTMRERDPVYYIEELNAWALTRFEDLWNASLDKTHFTAVHGTSPVPLLLDERLPPEVFLFMDPPQHRSHRNLVAPVYTPMNIAKLEQQIRQTSREVIAPYLLTGEMDVYKVSSHIALRTIGDIIGLAFEQILHIRQLVDTFYQRDPGHRGTTESGLEAFAEAQNYIYSLIEELRLQPPAQGTHIHTWLHSNIDGKPMSDEQVFFSIFALVVTGSDTLPLTVAATLYYLSQQPDGLVEVKNNLELVPNALAEATRIDQPTNILGRVVAEDIELRGKTLRKGDRVLFLYASANRDEREFEQPDQFLLHRKSKRNLSFGTGVHFCLGQHLAKLEGKIILEEIFTAVDEFEVDRDGSKRIFGEFLQGFNYLPITFSPKNS